jgi:hypothetical protein
MRGIMKRITVLIMVSMFLFAGSSFGDENATSASTNPLKLEVFNICRDVVDRTPVGIGSVYTVGVGKLYCFTKVIGAQTETKITHNWFRNGKLKASITLPVKSASWRTWSIKEISPKDSGDWMVEVLSETGAPIESILFFIE